MIARVAATIAIASLAACAPPPPPRTDGVGIADVMTTRALVGTWGWRHDSVEAAAPGAPSRRAGKDTAPGPHARRSGDDAIARREHEVWTFAPTDDWLTLAGTYRRDVDFTATDGVPFTCNQRATYRLSSSITVRALAAPGGALVEELAYDVAPSPCDHGLRRLARYHAAIEDDRLVLRWDGGIAHLDRLDPPPPPPAPAIATAPTGPWRWSSTSWTKHGLVQREDERWELVAGDDGALAGWYVRTVSIHDPRGAPIACAGAPSYTFVDRYLVRGRALADLSARSPEPAAVPVDDDRAGDWRLAEIAVEAGAHPCLASPRRSLDSATFDAIGEALVLTWRGGRRQVLLRPAS